MENKQRPVIAETRELVQKYHVLEKAQIYAYFALDGRDHFVGKAFKALEKERQVYIYPELDLVAASEEVIALVDEVNKLGLKFGIWMEPAKTIMILFFSKGDAEWKNRIP